MVGFPNLAIARPAGALPERFGVYRVLRTLATGGTSDLFLARADDSANPGALVVLKVLLPAFRDDERFEAMFLREAAAYARISHPAIVRLYEFFRDESGVVLVLEYVEGMALGKMLALMRSRGGKLGDLPALYIAWRLFGGLAAAHAARDPQTGQLSPVVHRDVNPTNLLVPWDGRVKVADFGAASLAGAEADTQTGLLKGTLGYFSPEQARGERLTARADVYSACLILWELLSGRRAIVRAGLSDVQVMQTMIAPTFPSLGGLRPDLPEALLDLVDNGLQPDADRRSLSARAICQALGELADMEEGRVELVRVLAQLRSPTGDVAAAHGQVRTPAPPPAATAAPVAAVAPYRARYLAPVVARPEAHPVASERPASSGPGWGALSFAVTVCAGLALLFWPLSPAPAGHAEAPAAPLVAPSGAPAQVDSDGASLIPTAASASGRPMASDDGTVTIPESSAGHRVWIDDRLVGESPATFSVRCGMHTVRVGSRGSEQRVEVPCGGVRVVE